MFVLGDRFGLYSTWTQYRVMLLYVIHDDCGLAEISKIFPKKKSSVPTHCLALIEL